MFCGLVLGGLWGLVFGLSRHPFLGILGLVIGGASGAIYAGFACYACGATLDKWTQAARARRYLAACFGFLVWLAVSAVFVGGVLVVLVLAAR